MLNPMPTVSIVQILILSLILIHFFLIQVRQSKSWASFWDEEAGVGRVLSSPLRFFGASQQASPLCQMTEVCFLSLLSLLSSLFPHQTRNHSNLCLSNLFPFTWASTSPNKNCAILYLFFILCAGLSRKHVIEGLVLICQDEIVPYVNAYLCCTAFMRPLKGCSWNMWI